MIDSIKSFLGSLFRRSSVPEDKEPPSKYDRHGVTVEFYPESRVYLVRTKNPHRYADYCYLQADYPTGIIEQCRIIYAAQFKEEEAAWRFADKYIEQRHKENVRVIRR